MKILKYLRVALLFILDASRPKFDVSGVAGNALIKLSSIGITNLSGKAGGSVFAHNRGGNYVRNFAVPSNPDTPAQSAARAAFGSFASAWRSLTQEQRDAWIEAAKNFPYIDRFGDEKIMSGENLYISLNQNLRTIDVTPPLSSPPTPAGVDGIISLSNDAGIAAGIFSMVLNAVLADNSEATTVYAIYATGVVSPGVGYFKNRFRFIGTATEVDLGDEFDITTMYESVFPTPTGGGKIAVKIAPINSSTGERGAEISSSGIITITP